MHSVGILLLRMPRHAVRRPHESAHGAAIAGEQHLPGDTCASQDIKGPGVGKRSRWGTCCKRTTPIWGGSPKRSIPSSTSAPFRTLQHVGSFPGNGLRSRSAWPDPGAVFWETVTEWKKSADEGHNSPPPCWARMRPEKRPAGLHRITSVLCES